MVSFFSQMTIKSVQFRFCYLLQKDFVKRKEVSMSHEYMTSYQVSNTEYLWKFTMLS